jgi:hypothetical protein
LGRRLIHSLVFPPKELFVIPRACVPAILLVIVIAGCGGSASTGSTATLGAHALPAINPPEYIPGPLNGLSTPRRLALRRPLAVMIENYAPDSRPQSGLGAASTVVETLAEAGITRFMAIYLEHDAAKVGPVRSTRMYFNRWAAGFHAILTHVGGNDDAQAALWHLPDVFNIDENRWEVSLYDTGTPLFWRSADRVPPHNMYTSTYKLRAYARQHNQNWAFLEANLPHKPNAPLSRRGHSGSISIHFVDPLNPQEQPNYDVQYTYNRATNAYTRYMGGSPHVDSATNRVLAPANVIVMRTNNAVPDPAAGPTPDSILIPTIGSGKAWFFRDGTVQFGHWQQRNQNAPLRFYDARWHAVAFNPGQTWVEVAPSTTAVTWQFR